MQDDVSKPWGTPKEYSAEWMAETQEKLFNMLALLHKRGSLTVDNVNTFSRLINVSVLKEFLNLPHPDQALSWIMDMVRTHASPRPAPLSKSSPSLLSLKTLPSDPDLVSAEGSSPSQKLSPSGKQSLHDMDDVQSLSPCARSSAVSAPIPISSVAPSWSSAISSSPLSDPFSTAPSLSIPSSLTSASPFGSSVSRTPTKSSYSMSASSSTPFLSTKSTFSFRNLFSFASPSPLGAAPPQHSSEDETDTATTKGRSRKVTLHLPVDKEEAAAYENRQLSPEGLIKVLLCPDQEQVDFRSIYMLSFRSFTTPSDLLTRLFFYYDHPYEVLDESAVTETISQTVHLKVVSLLNYWLKTYFTDFTPELRTTLHGLLEERSQSDPESKALVALHQVLQRLEGTRRDSMEKEKMSPISNNSNTNDNSDNINKTSADEKKAETGGLRPRSGPNGSSSSYLSSTSSLSSKAGPGSLGGRGTRRTRLDILEVAPGDLARELTLLDFELFKRILPLELTDQSWKKQPEKSGNVVAFIQAFNDRAQWVAGELLARTKINERTIMKERFIDTAFECLKLENFHTTFAIMAALTQHAVHRLKDLQGALGSAHERIAEQLRAITSSDDNYRAYRAVFKRALLANRTCLPHLGVALKNLTLYQAASPYEQQHKVVDVNRLVLVASEIKHVEECTKRSYKLPSDPELRRKVRRALEKFAGKTDDELIARSMALEPKMTWQQYNQKVCLDVLHEEGFL